MTAAPESPSRTSTQRDLAVVGVVALVWLAVVVTMMVSDVWDESKSLDLFASHGFIELVRSNWQPDGPQGITLFRPLPLILYTAIAQIVGDPEVTWRLLRGVNAVLLLTSTALLWLVVRRKRGWDRWVELEFLVALLFSGSALIAAGWFANAFDVMALAWISLALERLSRSRPVAAGVAFGLAFFCKEIAVLAVVLLVILLWLGTFDRRQTQTALAVAACFLLLYLGLRLAAVAPGSGADLRPLTLGGTGAGLLRLADSLWWQVASPPLRFVGIPVLAVCLLLIKNSRAVVGIGALLVTAAAIYGPFLTRAPGPLISPDNFFGRLFLVPVALVLLLMALYGRRHLILVVLVPVLWGAAITVDRHLQFQRAYRAVYDQAARVGELPFEVHCEFTDSTLRIGHHGVAIGHFPDADWIFRSDGRLARRNGGERGSDAP